jgi:hypothetical protein
MSLEVQIGGLKMFFKHQKQRNKEENTRREGRGLLIFCLKILEEML